MNTTTTAPAHVCPAGPGPCANQPCPLDDAIGPQVYRPRTTGNRYLYVKLAAVARGRAAVRIAEAGHMARAARAQVTR